jgi:mRNA interferase MazF
MERRMSKEILRGEIYWVDWTPARGSEQSGKRPALIIQNDVGNQYAGTVIVAAITTAYNKPYRFMVSLSAEQSGLPKDSTADLAMLITISKDRLGEKCGQITPHKMLEVDQALKVSLGLQ